MPQGKLIVECQRPYRCLARFRVTLPGGYSTDVCLTCIAGRQLSPCAGIAGLERKSLLELHDRLIDFLPGPAGNVISSLQNQVVRIDIIDNRDCEPFTLCLRQLSLE